MSIKHLPLTSTQGMADAMPRWVPKVTSRKASYPVRLQRRLAYVSGYLGLWLCSNHFTWGTATFSPGPGLPLGGAGWSRPIPTLGLLNWGPRREVTWKEVKESSVNSLTKRSTPRACSSITKAKMTSCVPSRGMSVSVDLASLGGGAGTSFWTSLMDSSSPSVLPAPTKAWHLGHRTLPHRIPRDGLPGGKEVEVETPEAQKLPRYRGETRLGSSGQVWVEEERVHRDPGLAPRISLSAQRKGSACPTRVTPLRYLHLVSVLHMRLACSLDTTMQMTRTKMRKFTCRAEGRATGGPLKTPSRPHPPLAPGPTAAPTTCPQHHSPRWRRGWAAGL